MYLPRDVFLSVQVIIMTTTTSVSSFDQRAFNIPANDVCVAREPLSQSERAFPAWETPPFYSNEIDMKGKQFPLVGKRCSRRDN